MDGLNTCHKCRKQIKNGEVRTYCGGWVWHKKCYSKTAPGKTKHRGV